MNDIANVLPKETETVRRIFDQWKARGDSQPVRGYLGASIIGHECERYLWFCYRQCCKHEFSGRMYRLFETGQLEEDRFSTDLQSIGVEVHATDPDGKQWEVSFLGGHFSGHMDGAGLGIPEAPKSWHVLEYKTHNDKSFVKLKKDGVRVAKPMHYMQTQLYMHGTGLTRALYLAKNKNDDDLYSERIHYDKEVAEGLVERAKRIITATEPPSRLSDRADFWQCKYCDARTICHNDGKVKALPVLALSCRHCCHATPDLEGTAAQWQCDKHNRALSPQDQGRCCSDHLCLPGLFSFDEPKEFEDDTITFAGGWKHGKNGLSSRELMSASIPAVTSGMVSEARERFGAEIVASNCVLDRYPSEDSRIIWQGPAEGLAAAWAAQGWADLKKLKQLDRCDCLDHAAAEYDSGRVAIFWRDRKQAEIRMGVE